jgi:riboflavin biosynthesis pyrimidine reductase
MAEQRELLQLYPAQNKVPLTGLYLSRNIKSSIAAAEIPCVYTNFLTSLDGRISLVDRETGKSSVPDATSNDRDWRLLLELAAPADAIIMSGRYLRDLAASDAQALPPFSGDTPPDLKEYRKQSGLPEKPELVFITRSLDIPVRALDMLAGRKLCIATVRNVNSATRDQLEKRDIELLSLGEYSVDGRHLIDALSARGHKLIYSIAGPEVLYTLLTAGVLQRIYLTTVLRVLAGEAYATMVRGPKLVPPFDFSLSAMYLDRYGPDGVEQLIQVYSRFERE